jgi:hypothetical protein
MAISRHPQLELKSKPILRLILTLSDRWVSCDCGLSMDREYHETVEDA